MRIDILNEKLKVLHDSKLISISDNFEENTTTLVFVTENLEKETIVTLKSVINNRCHDWKFGNIVLDAIIVENYNRFIDLLIYLEDMNEFQIEKKAYEDLLNKLNKKEIFLFEVNPSYGAYFLCLFKDIDIKVKNRMRV